MVAVKFRSNRSGWLPVQVVDDQEWNYQTGLGSIIVSAPFQNASVASHQTWQIDGAERKPSGVVHGERLNELEYAVTLTYR